MQERGERPLGGAAARGLLLLAHFACPLLFFTDLTRNPYFTQIALLNVSLAGAAALLLADAAWRGELPGLKTPVGTPLLCWAAACLFTWAWAWGHHQPFFRPAIAAEGARTLGFLLANSLLPFYLALLCSRKRAPAPSPAGWAACALLWGLFWTLFSQLRSPPGTALGIWTHLWDGYGALLWAGGLAAVLWLARGGSVHDFWHAALCAGFLASVYGVCQYFNIEWIWPKVLNPYGGRSVSTFGNPNFLSSYIVLLLPLAAAYYLAAAGRAARAVYGALFLVFAAALLCTLTRSSWLGAAAALGALALSPEARRLARARAASCAALAGAVALLVLLWPQSSVAGYAPSVLGRAREVLSAWGSGAPYGPWHQRVLIWASAWLMGNENPLWGKGFGLFELFYPFYQGHLLYALDFFRGLRTHANNAHNELLESWAQTGLLGLGLQLWLWTAFLAFCRRRLRARWERGGEAAQGSLWPAAAAAGAAGMLVDNMLNVSLHFAVPAFLFWWQAGSAAGLLEEGPERRGGWLLSSRATRAAACALALALGACWGWAWARQWNRETRYFLGFKLMRGGYAAAAAAQLEAAHAWHAREVNANYELGNAYAKAERFPQAARAYEEALRSNAGYDEIHFNLATVLSQRLGRKEEALPHYLAAHWINPVSPEIYAALSAFYLAEPRRYRDAAIALLEEALLFQPGNPHFLNNLGHLNLQAGRPEKARALLAAALRVDPELRAAESSLRLLSPSGAPPPVLAAVERYRELEARLQRRDYSARSLELARGAASDFPGSAKARFYMGYLELLHGRTQAALGALEPLAGADPGNPALLKSLAEAYLRSGRREDALRSLRAALAASPSDAAARQRLAELERGP